MNSSSSSVGGFTVRENSGFVNPERRHLKPRAKNNALIAIIAVYLAAGAVAFVAMPALTR